MRATIVAIFGVGTLVACSSPNPPSSAAGGAGASASMAGASAGGAGGAASSNAGAGGSSAGQSTTGGAGGSATSRSHYGQVLVQSLTRPGNGVTLNARFVSTATPSTTVCTNIDEGPCRATTCEMAAAGDSITTYASAGTVTITSPEVMGTATLTPSADGTYVAPTQMPFEKSFLGGELLQIKATGSMVPAFEGELNVPLILLFSQPAFVASQGSLEAPRSQDLALAWTRGAKDVALYVIGSSARPDGQPGSASINCNFPSEPGSGVIKSSLLQVLKPEAQLNLFTVGSKLIEAGEYSVTLGATLPAANPDKAILPNIVLK
jgi:hypothetical protein